MIIRLKGATFTTNIGTLDSWSIKYTTTNGSVTKKSGALSIKKDDTDGEILVFEFDTAKYTYKSGTIMSNGVSAGTISVSGNTITVNVNAGTTLGGKVEINFVMEAIGGGEPDIPDTPTNYTFTINPNPTSATVTLSATGYSTVSGTGSKSITVANGTTVNWSVSADGYTTRTGSWTISGGNKTENIALTASGGATSNYTLIHGNKYASGHETNTARASISPLTIIVPNGVTITNKSTIKWAYYTNVDTSNMPSGSGIGGWGDYTYTGTGAAIGISFKKVDDSAFDWSVDSTNPADYFDVSDEGLWDGTAEPEDPSNPEGTLGDITTIILVNGNPYGSTEQQAAANRVHSETALYAPAGTVITCKDTTTYKWALRRVKSETNLADGGDAAYKPDSVWTTKASYTTEKNGYWCFILLKASNADFDWSVDSNKVSDYFTVS